MTEEQPIIGIVLGSKESTPLDFWVGVLDGHQLELDDIVTVEGQTSDGEVIEYFGSVDSVRKIYEGTQFDSDAFRVAAGHLPAEVSYAAHIQVTRITPEYFIPPEPGADVKLVRGAALNQALYFDDMERKVPVGHLRSGEPVYVNLDFLDGRRGAHASISGVSGVATKTSFATFILYSLFHTDALGASASNTRAIIFNVKGEDLLWLDKPNTALDESARQQYSRMGMEAGPFRSVGIFAPAKRSEGPLVPDTGSRQGGVTPYVWSMREFAMSKLLRFAFSEEDSRAQLAFVVQRVESFLHQWARGTDKAFNWVITGDGARITSFKELVDYLDGGALEEICQGTSIATGTMDAFRRRLHAANARMGHLVQTVDKPEQYRIDWHSNQVTVIDIHNLQSAGQSFVVGVVLKRLMEEKERIGMREPVVFIVLDELNKYAPRQGKSSISEVIRDMAERGRSLGVSLFGAQQTASEVERRVVGNAALKVVGRLDNAEARRNEYGWLVGSAKQRATMIRPGTMILSQPEVPTPLLVQFPFPSWATREDEVARDQPAEQDLFGGFGDD